MTLRPATRLAHTCTAPGHDPGGAGAAPAAPADSCSPARRGAPFPRAASTSGAPARVSAKPWPGPPAPSRLVVGRWLLPPWLGTAHSPHRRRRCLPFRIQPRGRARRRAGRGFPDMHRAGSTFRLAGGPRSPSSSAAPTPGAVRLARGDQRTSGLIPGTGDKCCTPPNAPLALGAVPFFRFRRRVGSSGLGWIPDGIGAGIPDPIASRRPFRARRLSSACKPRDRASGRRGVFFCVQLGALGGAPLFPNVPSRDPRGEAFDGYQESAAPGDLCLDTAPQSTGEGRASPAQPGAAPLFLAVIPGAASGQLEHSPTTDQDGGLGLERRPLLPTLPPASPPAAARRSTVTGIHEWRRARHLLTRPDTTPPPSHPAWRGACCSHGSQHRGDGLRGASRQGVTGHDETHLGAGIGAARRSGHRA